MGYIILDREGEDGGKMRENMRRNMRGGYRYEGHSPMMRGGDSWEHGYRMGYRHGWEDSEDDMMKDDGEKFRRMRDSRGRFI
jgi:hypothetical protein